MSDSTVRFTLRGSHDGHFVLCEQVNYAERDSKILKKTMLRGVLVPSDSVVPASAWTFALRFDSEFCMELLLANLGILLCVRITLCL